MLCVTGQCGVLRGLMNQVRNDMKPSCPTFHFGSLNPSCHTTWEDQRALVSRMIKDLDESEPYGSLEDKLVNWNKTCAAYTGGNGRNRLVEARGPRGASSSSYEGSLEICSAWSSLEEESEEETESEKVAADVRVKIRIAMASVHFE